MTYQLGTCNAMLDLEDIDLSVYHHSTSIHFHSFNAVFIKRNCISDKCMQRIEFDFLVMCCILYHFSYHIARFSLAYLCSPVWVSKHHFQAMCCPVKVYCGFDVSCIVACS